MRIYITGVSGFVGRHLAHHFMAHHHIVVGSGHSQASETRAPKSLERFDELALGQEAPEGTFDKVDAMVHAAYDPAPEREAINVEGTDRWRDQGEQAGVEHQVFVSSHSASGNAPSAYGRQKSRLESIFLDRGHEVVRPGLVIGNGGLFGRMTDMVERLPFVPLIDGGVAATPITSPEDLACAIQAIWAGTGRGRAFNLFNQKPVPLVDLLRAVRHATGRRVPFLPIPSALLLPPLWIARRLGLPLPVDEENVHGYRAMSQHHRVSDYPTLLGHETSLASMLDHTMAQRQATNTTT